MGQSASSGSPIARVLADFVHGLSFDDLPPNVQRLLPSFVLDQLVCQSVGSLISHNALVREYALRESPAGQCSVIRGGTARAEWAALANATAGHGFEMDDTHARALSHPGCVATPATLAIAEESDARGRETLVALALAYEVGIRVGLAVQPSMLTSRGFHETCVTGVFGAAAAAARLLGLAPIAIADAFGIAASHASGTIEYGRSGGEVKRLHAGLGAMGGIRAARLAAMGLTGPAQSFEGVKGLLQAVAAEPNTEVLTRDLGGVWHLEQLFPKEFCAAATIHGPVLALLAIMREHGMAASDIEAVTAGVDSFSAGHLGTLGAQPATLAGAQFSLRYSLGMAAVLGGNGYKEYRAVEDDNFSNPEILRIAERVRVAIDTDADGAFPERLIGRVTVQCANGKRYERMGQAMSSWDTAFVEGRFSRTIGDEFGPESASRVREGVLSLSLDAPIRGALAPLAAAPPKPPLVDDRPSGR